MLHLAPAADQFLACFNVCFRFLNATVWFIVAIFSPSSLHNASRRRWRDIPVGEKGEWKGGGVEEGIGLLYDHTEGQCRRA